LDIPELDAAGALAPLDAAGAWLAGVAGELAVGVGAVPLQPKTIIATIARAPARLGI